MLIQAMEPPITLPAGSEPVLVKSQATCKFTIWHNPKRLPLFPIESKEVPIQKADYFNLNAE